MLAKVAVTFKDGVLDPEAAAIHKALQGLGFEGVRAVRRVKLIELALAHGDVGAARAEAERMCERLLANPVIEDWRIEIVEDA